MTQQWHEWRSEGLGSSDAPIIMGVSPWSTAYQLWEQKTKKTVRSFSNWATDRGNRLEPKARADYEFKFGYEAPAILAVNGQFPFIRASLDGYNAERGIVLEIKCPGKDDHAKAIEGRIPNKYYPQVQHQLLACPDAKLAHYYSYDGETGACVIVERDPVYQKQLFEALCKFWACVQADEPPELGEKDYKVVRNEDLQASLDILDAVKAEIKGLEKTKLKFESLIFSHEEVLGQRVAVGPWKINLCYRKGAVDYNKIQGVDLEQFRKAATSYRTITKDKSHEGS